MIDEQDVDVVEYMSVFFTNLLLFIKKYEIQNKLFQASETTFSTNSVFQPIDFHSNNNAC